LLILNIFFLNFLYILGSKKGAAATAAKWKRTREMAISGEFDEIDDDHFVQHYSTLRKINKDFAKRPPNLIAPNARGWRGVGIWYYGATHTGKSFAARQEYPEAFIKSAKNKWWDGYKGEKHVIIDDIDKSHDYMGFDLKIWGDLYTFPAETKGGAIWARPEMIIVTSNYHPRDIWTDPNMLQPILDRFKVTRFVNLGDLSTPSANSQHEQVRPAFVEGFIAPHMVTDLQNALNFDFLELP